MTATTANRGYPYPEGSDFLGDTAAHIQALAEAVDADAVGAGWVAATLQNGWVNYGSPYQTARYRKLAGIVTVQGLVKSGTTSTGTTVLTLPAGYRPAATIFFTTQSESSLCVQRVESDGTLRIGVGANALSMSLFAVFPADA